MRRLLRVREGVRGAKASFFLVAAVNMIAGGNDEGFVGNWSKAKPERQLSKLTRVFVSKAVSRYACHRTPKVALGLAFMDLCN